MPILASSTYVNAYGKAGGVVTVATSPLPLDSMNGTQDAFVVKYNSSGKALWSARIASSGVDVGYGITTDPGGNVYVTGQGGSGSVVTAFNFDGTAFLPRLASSGNTDAFIVKYNSNGLVQWAARVASGTLDIGFAIATDSGGNVYATGQAAVGQVTTAFNANETAFSPTLVNSGSFDAFIVKYNTDGVVQWMARVASSGQDVGYGIATDSSGNVYVTGMGGSAAVVTAFSAPGNIAFSPTIPSSGNNDAFIVKYNTDGVVQWMARVASSGQDIGFAIATDPAGNVYITGQSGSAVVTVFDASGNAFSPTIPSSGNADVFIVKYNTNGAVQWATRIGSSGGDIGYGIATDSSGNVYIAGLGGPSVTVTAFSAPGNIAFSPTITNAGNDIFIVKYNTNGIVQWITRVGSVLADIGYGIATDSGGNVYVTGQGGGTTVTAFSAGNIAFSPTLANSGGNDAFIVKYNTLGVVQWITRIGSQLSDIGRGITVDSNSNVYTTGLFTGNPLSVYGQALSLFSTVPNLGNTDTFIVKYNTNGGPQWVTRIGSSGEDIAYGIARDSSGNVYVIGQGGSGATVTAFSAPGTATPSFTLPNAGGSDAFIVKYNTNGVAQWITRVASTATDTGWAIATDSSDNVYVGGQGGSGAAVTAFSAPGNIAFSPALANVGGSDAFIVKYNTDGAVQWVTRIAGTGLDIAHGIATDSNSNVYVTGRYAAAATAFSAPGDIAFSPGLAVSGGPDVFIVKYNTNGQVQWNARLASTGTDAGLGIATDSGGNVYIIGQGDSAVVTVFDASGNAFSPTLPNAGGSDAFIVKYNTSGDVQWITRVASNSVDIGYGIATDSSGNIYVTGQNERSGSLFNSDGTTFNVPLGNSGGFDAFIAKYNTNGFVQWVARIASSGVDIGYGIATDASNNVYVTGNSAAANVQIINSDGSMFVVIDINGTFTVKYNSDGIAQWAQMVRGGGMISGRGGGVAVDSFGNSYVTGQSITGQALQVYNVDYTPYLFTNASRSNDAFIVKYSSNASPQWIARIASSEGDIGYGIATDSGGNVYVTGRGGSGAVITAFNANGTAFSQTLTNSGGDDTYVVKYDTNGVVQWVTRIASTGTDIGYSIATDSSGNVYVTGSYFGVLTAFNAPGTIAFSPTLTNTTSTDIFIVKYNTSGQVQWNVRMTSPDEDAGVGIATDSSGNVYVTGQFGFGSTGALTAFNANGTQFPTTIANSGSDVFVVKYNTIGVAQWIARIGGTGTQIAYAIATDSAGNVYVIGQTGFNTSTVAFQANNGAANVSLVAVSGIDAFIVKYNTNGFPQWITRVAGANTDIGYQIATDSAGNVYVTGTYNGVVNAFSVGNTPFSPALADSGSGDAFIVKYNTNGQVQWNARVASTATETGYAIATDSGGDVYVTCDFTASASAVSAFNANGTLFGSAGIPIINRGTGTIVVKYNTNGVVQWISAMNGTGNDSARGIALDPSRNFYLTGFFNSSALVPFDA